VKLNLGGTLSSYFEYNSNLNTTDIKKITHKNTPTQPTTLKLSKNVSVSILHIHLLLIYSFLSFIFCVPIPDSNPTLFQLKVLVLSLKFSYHPLLFPLPLLSYPRLPFPPIPQIPQSFLRH